MQKVNRSKSKVACSKRSKSPKKNSCTFCPLCRCSAHSPLVINHSLYRKYSSSQNHHYLSQANSLLKSAPEILWGEEEYLNRYYRGASRRQVLSRLKQGKIEKWYPRIFHPFIREILTKRHYRQRLLECFKMAKKLGVSVDSINFSSFLLSLSRQKPGCGAGFDPWLLEISGTVGLAGTSQPVEVPVEIH